MLWRRGRAVSGRTALWSAATRLFAATDLCFSPTLQVFYHLGDLDDALTYALGAGSLFDVNSSAEYVQTILGEQSLY